METKKIIVDVPYPSTEGITYDIASADIISPAYAGLHGELTAISQYTYHHFYFDSYGYNETAAVLEGISIAEMSHFELLGKTLLSLGVDPIMSQKPPKRYNYFNTSTVAYSNTPQRMLMDDISGEMTAIRDYKDMLRRLINEKVAAIISRIIMDEELHVVILKEQLKKIMELNI